YFFTWQGLLTFGASMVMVKVVHELGHALTATRYGVHVSNMGVAFMVFFPLLYTDVSDSWRLRSRRQRLYIGAAGMVAEIYIALICTFLWAFLPEGILRSAAFFLATTSWIFTVFVNVNPFLKFDGYYLLADYWGVDNLQDRAFGLGRWKLREILFDLRQPRPDPKLLSMHRRLIVYAWLTWCYRVFLFLSIGLVVYYMFFKLLGLLILVLTFYRFIVKPLMNELKEWWGLRRAIAARPRSYVTGVTCVAGIVMLFIPWDTRIQAPAVLYAQQRPVVFPPVASQIVEIHAAPGQKVQAGELMFRLRAPELAHEIEITAKELSVVQLRVDRTAASVEDRENLQVLIQQREELRTKLAGLQERERQLVVRAPIDGVVTALAPNLQEGQWIPQTSSLAKLVSGDRGVVEAVVAEEDLGRINVENEAQFIADELEIEKIALRVESIEEANLATLHLSYLQSLHNGAVAVRMDSDGHPIPETSVYRINLIPEKSGALPPRVVRGVASINGERVSIARRAYERIAGVLVRESGF
ncbi:MAG: HlyD family efflux transporter periplasmic adaptor subunit, partial [Pseudomonadota bacterium]